MAEPAKGLHEGLVVAGFGRHFIVETADGQRRICHPRGKKSDAVVGDHVHWSASHDEGSIESVDERRNLFWRQDEIRSKSFAANIDQVLVLIAAEPEFSEHQLARALIAAEAQRIKAIVALNKSDMVDAFERAWQRLGPYQHMHYGVLPLSLKYSSNVDRDKLLNHMRGKTTLVLGPSGAGKSTLINLLVPGAQAQTNSISQALNSGKHTTTSTTLYWADPATRDTALIDSPGFQEFGLQHIEPMQLASLMPDIREHLGNCRFHNCTHRHEPGCGVMQAVDAKAVEQPIAAGRYRIYRDLFEELSQPPQY